MAVATAAPAGRVWRRRGGALGGSDCSGWRSSAFATRPRAGCGPTRCRRGRSRRGARRVRRRSALGAGVRGRPPGPRCRQRARGVGRRRMPVWEFAAYNSAGGRVRSNRFPRPRREIAIPAPREARQARGTRLLSLGARQSASCRGGRETSRPLPDYDYAAPPHAGGCFASGFTGFPSAIRGSISPSAAIYRDLAALDFSPAASRCGARPYPRRQAPAARPRIRGRA